jgi:flagellar hook-basal body complex protein FliE
MLSPALAALRNALIAKGYAKRTQFEDNLLDELKEVDSTLEKAKDTKRELTEGVEKKAMPSILGPKPGACPVCGKS